MPCGAFAAGDAKVFESLKLAVEQGELVVVGGEEGARADAVVQVFDGCPGEREAVVGGGAAAHFVEQDERARGRGVEDGGGLGHFDHKGGAAAADVVAGADAGEDAVDQAEAHVRGGDEGAALGKDDEERGHAEIGGFAAHVGAGDECE